MQSKIPAVIVALASQAFEAEEFFPLIRNASETSLISRSTLEYELRLLKIISMGWGLSYYLLDEELKKEILAGFWQEIYLFSKELDEISHAMGIEVSYFSIVQKRFDAYLAKVQGFPMNNLATFMGLAFADFCGDEGDSDAALIGKKIFVDTLNHLRVFLAGEGLISTGSPSNPAQTP